MSTTTAQKLRALDDSVWKRPYCELRLRAASELEALQKEVAWRKEHMEESDKELCQIQDWLRAGGDIFISSSEMMARVKERIRDLIATEGEVGDLRTQNQGLRDQLTEASVLIEKIGTTGVERTDIILKSEQWLKNQP